ncbi:MAG: hypothetical protein J2P31_06150 [Blastocatellia bacterium]|nr:hypothetical protein [Blastocatellia bacterium]
MAEIVLLLRYQWRAYWRRLSRESLSQVLLVLTFGWLIFIKLPPLLFQAARNLTLGRTELIEGILMLFALAWLFIPHEDANISMTAQNLLRFPLSLNTLLAVRLFSLFFSPLVMIIVIGSLISSLPFLKSRNPVLGIVAAILFLSLAALMGMCLSHLIRITAWRRGLLAAAAVILIPLGTSVLVSGNQARQSSVWQTLLSPAHLAASAGNRSVSVALITILLLITISAAAAIYPLRWIFRRSLCAQGPDQGSRKRKAAIIRLPGKLGGLVGKEQRNFRRTFFPWAGLLFSLPCGLILLRNANLPANSRAAILLVILVVCLTNFDLAVNFFGLDRAWELNRYLIFPLRGKEIVIAKNLGIALITAMQLAPILPLACWCYGWRETGLEAIEAATTLLALLAWGNLRSSKPFDQPGRQERIYTLVSGRHLSRFAALCWKEDRAQMGKDPGKIVIRCRLIAFESFQGVHRRSLTSGN